MALHFRKPKNTLEFGGRTAYEAEGDSGEAVRKCPNCHKEIPLSVLQENEQVCPCGHHFRLRARARLRLLLDKGSFRELYGNLISENPLAFEGYDEKLEKVRADTGETEAVITGVGRIKGIFTAVFAMDPYFMMGSMGSIVGEKITRLFEYAIRQHLPVIGFTASGGARMQEGLLSLMQMAKTSAAVKWHSDAGLLYVTVLTDPTTGGVTASFAMEGDLILSEPDALVGFAGARVIEQTTRKRLPQGFQRADFLLEHGFCDAIMDRREQREGLAQILLMHGCGVEAKESARKSAEESTEKSAERT